MKRKDSTTTVPRWFTCTVRGCSKPAVRSLAGCETCHHQRCFKHASRSFHRCKEYWDMSDEAWRAKIDRQIDRVRSRINEDAVCKYASSLNGGKTCSMEHTNMTGFANYHARIHFHDGSRSWLLRVPRNIAYLGGPPESLAEYLVVSEYATMKFLETTAVPAPRAFGYGTCSDGNDHGVGVNFLLIEELPGKAWTGGGRNDADEKTRDQKANIWSGLADILAELARHPFPKAGSLCMDGARVQVGPAASDRFQELDPDGPFETALDYYTAWAEQYLALIADRQLYMRYPVDAYLAYRFLKENAGQLVQEEAKAKGNTTPGEGFFLKHIDDHGGHLLIDDDGNITGVIDWTMARVVPRGEAFGPSLVSVDMEALSRGDVSLGMDDAALAAALRKKGHLDLARCMEDENEKARRFFWGLALEPVFDGSQLRRALPEANGILKAFGVQQPWEEWKKTALREYGADKRLQKLLRACPPKRPSLPRRCKRVHRA